MDVINFSPHFIIDVIIFAWFFFMRRSDMVKMACSIVHQGWFWFAPSQWEILLQNNAVSHWLGANLESALVHYIYPTSIHSSHASFVIGIRGTHGPDPSYLGQKLAFMSDDRWVQRLGAHCNIKTIFPCTGNHIIQLKFILIIAIRSSSKFIFPKKYTKTSICDMVAIDDTHNVHMYCASVYQKRPRLIEPAALILAI